jgi:hypothetical protein
VIKLPNELGREVAARAQILGTGKTSSDVCAFCRSLLRLPENAPFATVRPHYITSPPPAVVSYQLHGYDGRSALFQQPL